MNAFGSASQKYPIYDPRKVREYRAQFLRDRIPSLDRANSFYNTVGVRPSRGWILMRRKDYDLIDTYSTELQLDVGDPNADDNVGTLKNLAIVQAYCVTRGIAADENALYLVELTDARGVLHNRWFQHPLTAQYNIRSPAYPQTFHPSSMNSGTTWTWSTMLQNIWESMPLLGSWPSLPYAPAGTPEGFWFSGVPAYKALCDVLGHIGMTIAADLTQSGGQFSIVDDGAADADFTALQSTYEDRLEDDLEWIDTGAGRVPKTVKVLFRRRNSVYGTEETVYYGNDDIAKQWNMSGIYTVLQDAPAHFASAVGTHHIWSDFTVRYDDSSNPLDADIAVARQIATERVNQYFDAIYSRTSGSMTQVYTGALPFLTGSQVDGVCYYQDYSSQERQGWKTKIVRDTCPWPDIFDR